MKESTVLSIWLVVLKTDRILKTQLKSITCNCNRIKHQELENQDSINNNYKRPLSAGKKWTIVSNYLKWILFTWTLAGETHLCWQSECREELTIKLSLIVLSSLRYELGLSTSAFPLSEKKEVWLLSLPTKRCAHTPKHKCYTSVCLSSYTICSHYKVGHWQ